MSFTFLDGFVGLTECFASLRETMPRCLQSSWLPSRVKSGCYQAVEAFSKLNSFAVRSRETSARFYVTSSWANVFSHGKRLSVCTCGRFLFRWLDTWCESLRWCHAFYAYSPVTALTRGNYAFWAAGFVKVTSQGQLGLIMHW